MNITHFIDKYDITIWSSKSTSNPGSGSIGRLAFMVLWGGGQIRGSISFFPDAAILPEPTSDAQGKIQVHLNASHMETVMELLRQENPVWIWLNDSSGLTQAGLAAGNEPVGEEEGAAG